MKQTGKVGIGKVVLRDREDLVAVFPQENGLVLQKLRYPHEIRSIQDVPELIRRDESRQERDEDGDDAGGTDGYLAF